MDYKDMVIAINFCLETKMNCSVVYNQR